MTPQENINDILTRSKIEPDLQRSLVDLFNFFGTKVKEYLRRELDRSDSYLAAEGLVSGLEAMRDMLSQLRSGSSGGFERFINSALEDSVFDGGRLLLPFFLDLRREMDLRKVFLSDTQYHKLLDAELYMFKDLPTEIIAIHLSKTLLYDFSKTDVFMQCKRVYYWQSKDMDPTWSSILQKALESNGEVLGNVVLVISDKRVNSTVGAWIKDLNVKVPQSKANLGTAGYIDKSEEVAKLSGVDKSLLIQIFKLYFWLKMPSVDREEIDKFESTLGNFGFSFDENPDKSSLLATVPRQQLQDKPRNALQNSIQLDRDYPKVPVPPEKRAVNLQEKLLASQKETGKLSGEGLDEKLIGVGSLASQHQIPTKAPVSSKQFDFQSNNLPSGDRDVPVSVNSVKQAPSQNNISEGKKDSAVGVAPTKPKLGEIETSLHIKPDISGIKFRPQVQNRASVNIQELLSKQDQAQRKPQSIDLSGSKLDLEDLGPKPATDSEIEENK